jgi:hypothetical protein
MQRGDEFRLLVVAVIDDGFMDAAESRSRAGGNVIDEPSDLSTSTMKSEPVLPIVWGGMSFVGRSVWGTAGMLGACWGAGWASAFPPAARPTAGAAAMPARN